MTQEDKELLIKDLCARLPYGVVIHFDEKTDQDDERLYGMRENGGKLLINDAFYIEEIKPFLFPLSSMTKEQKEFIKNRFCYDWDIDDHPYSLWAYCIEIGDADELIDFFHKNHFDYRCLIEKGLAINATGLNVY